MKFNPIYEIIAKLTLAQTYLADGAYFSTARCLREAANSLDKLQAYRLSPAPEITDIEPEKDFTI